MKLTAMYVDDNAFEKGEWFDDLPEMGNLQLKVRGVQNADYRKLQSKLTAALPRNLKPGGNVEPDSQDRILSKCLARTVLLDWRGLEGDDGQPIPFSAEKALELLTDKRLRRFRDAVIYAATQVGEGVGCAEPRDEPIAA